MNLFLVKIGKKAFRPTIDKEVNYEYFRKENNECFCHIVIASEAKQSPVVLGFAKIRDCFVVPPRNDALGKCLLFEPLNLDFLNYLAHILLSGSNAQRQLGGFIADNVKGNHLERFPQHVREGIVLHRRVDAFTDDHELVREARALLRPYFGRYSGIFLDIFYDYFLAKNWRQFSKVPLRLFAYRFYAGMVWNRRWLPLSVKGFLWHFIGTNRLYKYSTLSGVQRALWIMGNYSSLPQMSEEAIQILLKHEQELEKGFLKFFPQVEEFAKTFTPPTP